MESGLHLWHMLDKVSGMHTRQEHAVKLLTQIPLTCLSSFYYADERTTDGLPVMRDIDGELAGKEYLKLAQTPEQLPWLYTYTKDESYKSFEEGDYLRTVDNDDPHFVQGGRWKSKPRA